MVTQGGRGAGPGPVECFFAHLTARQWDALATVLAVDVERVGPLGDRVVGRRAYIDHLRAQVPPDYGNDVHRVTYTADGCGAFARVTEHLVYPDRSLHLEELYAFEIDAAGLLRTVEVFWQTPGFRPPEASSR